MTKIVDDRQRLDGLQNQTVVENLRWLIANKRVSANHYAAYCAEIVRLGPELLERALASPSEGNKKGGDDDRRVRQGSTPDARRSDTTMPGSYEGRASSRPQEQPRKATGEDWQFCIDGRPASQPRETWRMAADDAVAAGYAEWHDPSGNLNWDAVAAGSIVRVPRAMSVSPAAAQGWQTVPIEPTPEMLRAYKTSLKAYIDALPVEQRVPGGFTVNEPLKGVLRWQAMLAAAPPSPAAQERKKGEQT